MFHKRSAFCGGRSFGAYNKKNCKFLTWSLMKNDDKQYNLPNLRLIDITLLQWIAIKLQCKYEKLSAYHFVFFALSVCTSVKCYCEGGWAQLSVVSREAMITDTADRYCVYTGSVAITVAVIICKTSIASRPHVNVSFATATLQKPLWIP